MTDAVKPSKYAVDFLACAGQYKLNPVLSLMCGSAEDEIFLAQNGLDVYAADNDTGRLVQVRLNPPATKTGSIKVICADILQPLPLAGRSFNSLYFKFGLHYFSNDQIRQIIIPGIGKLLNPGSLVSIVYRYIDAESTDRTRYEIPEINGGKVIFTGKSSGEIMARYIYDEAAAKKLFSDKFDIIKAGTRREQLYNRFSTDNNSIITSLLMTVR